MIIQVNHIGDSITGSYNGVPFGIGYSKEKWGAMKALEDAANTATEIDVLKKILDDFKPMTEESYKELIQSACPFIYVNRATNKFYLQVPETDIQILSKALPKEFVDRVLTSLEKDLDIMPLIKCMIRFFRNPNYTDAKAKLFAAYINATYTNDFERQKFLEKGLSPEVAKERATTTQVSITKEGLMATYKVVKEIDWKFTIDDQGNPVKKKRYEAKIDEFSGIITYIAPEHIEDKVFEPAYQGQGGDAFSSGDTTGHIVRVGHIHALDSWDKVDCRDNNSCNPGLHVGNLDYIRGYQNEGTLTLNVFVDPMHIGAVVDGHDGAMRVKQYFTYDAFGGVNRGIYHSSDYAKKTDAEYIQMLEASIKELGRLELDTEDSINQSKREKNALILE